MIDTIVLTLSRNMFTISNPDKFEPSARLILGNNTSMGSRGYIQCKQNPTKEELRSGFYKPRLTLTNRFNHTGNREPTLKIELSLPKLLLKNNFNELTDHDFERVIELLEANLKYMGVQVSTLALKQASVSSIHYSKNISLSNGITSRYLIRKIKEANVKMALDINQTDYKNEGYSYKWHSNTYEIAFYDKIKDLETAKFSEKRAIEKDNELQSNLFPELIKRPEVLRIEVRLNNRQK